MESNDDYIPILACVKFRLQAVKEAKELPEFRQLQDWAAEVIKEKQVALKKVIFDALKLEQKMLQENLTNTSVSQFPWQPNCFSWRRAWILCRAIILWLICLENIGRCCSPSIPTSTWRISSCSTRQNSMLEPCHQPLWMPRTHKQWCIKCVIKSVFILSWDHHLQWIKENELSISLKKEVKKQLMWQKMEDVTIEKLTTNFLLTVTSSVTWFIVKLRPWWRKWSIRRLMQSWIQQETPRWAKLPWAPLTKRKKTATTNRETRTKGTTRLTRRQRRKLSERQNKKEQPAEPETKDDKLMMLTMLLCMAPHSKTDPNQSSEEGGTDVPTEDGSGLSHCGPSSLQSFWFPCWHQQNHQSQCHWLPCPNVTLGIFQQVNQHGLSWSHH